MVHISSWLRHTLAAALSFGIGTLVTLLLLKHTPSSAIELAVFMASYAGTLGTLLYRGELAVLAFSKQGLISTLMAFVWSAAFFLLASYIGQWSGRGTADLASRLPILTVSAATAIFCLLPLRWVRSFSVRRGAP
jgi:hypothetical protein